MPLNLTIHHNANELTSNDKKQLLKIYIENYKKGLTRNYVPDKNTLEIKLENLGDNEELIVARNENETIMGFIRFSKPDNISIVEIDPNYQRQGIGTTLIKHLQSRFNKLIATVDALQPDGIKSLLSKMEFIEQKGGMRWLWTHDPKTNN